MTWKFEIENRLGVLTEIDEMVGWDKVNTEITRDKETHGVMFTASGYETFEFYGLSRILLQTEYEDYGAKGISFLVISQKTVTGFIVYDRLRFVFSKYEHHCGDSCYVKIPVEVSNETMILTNRWNQKVDLKATTSFDQTTLLESYDRLPFEIVLPSKAIFLKDQALTAEPSVEEFAGGLQEVYDSDGTDWNLTYAAIEFGLKDGQLSEIGSFFVRNTHYMNMTSQNNNGSTLPPAYFPPNPFPPPDDAFPGIGIWPLNLSPLLDYAEGSPNYGDISNPVQFDIRIKGELEVLETYLGTTAIAFFKLPARPGRVDNGELLSDYVRIAEQTIFNPGNSSLPFFLAPNSGSVAFDFTYTGDQNLGKDDRFYLFMPITERKTQAEIDNVTAGAKALKLTLDTDSHVLVTNLSKTAPTRCEVFMVNEALSRVAEVITDDSLRVFSDYFGRTDSQPYSHPADGCGSLEVVTNGIRVRRQENKIPGQPSVFALSMQDLFQGLNPIHNIGAGIEPDPNREGFNRLRIEDWRYFYKDEVILVHENVGKIVRKSNEKNIFSTYTAGYEKWEAEEYNGLDEIHTKRQFRTTLDSVKNDFVKLSSMLISGYAIEVTRRKGNTDSKDWRYDKECILLCMKRGSGTITEAVQFTSVSNSFTIIFGFPEPQENVFFNIGDTIEITNTASNNGTFTITNIIQIGTAYQIFLSGVLVTETAPAATFENVSPGIVSVELGNVTGASNIVDPDSLLNYRISPERNALRWMNRVLMSYKHFNPDAKILFTDGEGNYFARGMMDSDDCRLEASEIAENDEISVTVYANPDDAKPIMKAETVDYEYPMDVCEYRIVKNNPYGRIRFSNDCESGEGWIDKIKHNANEGKATFTLIPKV